MQKLIGNGISLYQLQNYLIFFIILKISLKSYMFLLIDLNMFLK